jgi:hypothetical protein
MNAAGCVIDWKSNRSSPEGTRLLLREAAISVRHQLLMLHQSVMQAIE